MAFRYIIYNTKELEWKGSPYTQFDKIDIMRQ